jgi:thiamine-phosphate pyrophosphorylase
MLVQRAVEAVEGGATAIQVRRKEGSSRDFYDLAILLSESLPPGFPLLVNSRLDIAREIDAFGVHLPEDHIPLSRFRDKEPSLVFGLSCHSLESALAAEREGADYLFFGTVFETPSKAAFGPPKGLEELGQVCGSVAIPVIGIGGIREDNMEGIRKSGAAGIAVIGALAYSSDPRAAAFALRRGWTRS